MWKFLLPVYLITVFLSFFANVPIHTIHLNRFLLQLHYVLTSLAAMPQPSVLCWMLTRSRNARIHPGIVDISVEEQGEDVLPKTPVP